jgi:hypothetical protein
MTSCDGVGEEERDISGSFKELMEISMIIVSKSI